MMKALYTKNCKTLRKEIKDTEVELLELKIYFLKFKIHWTDLTIN